MTHRKGEGKVHGLFRQYLFFGDIFYKLKFLLISKRRISLAILGVFSEELSRRAPPPVSRALHRNQAALAPLRGFAVPA